MNITPSNNINSQTFNAKFKIQRTKAYKPATDWFEGQWLKEKEEEWARKAWGIGTPRDTITIKLGRNNTGKEWLTKQTMTATSKVNGIKITNTDNGNTTNEYKGNAIILKIMVKKFISLLTYILIGKLNRNAKTEKYNILFK